MTIDAEMLARMAKADKAKAEPKGGGGGRGGMSDEEPVAAHTAHAPAADSGKARHNICICIIYIYKDIDLDR